MSEKTESEVLSLAESNDSDSEDHLDQYFSLGSRLRLGVLGFRIRLVVFKIGSGFEYFEPRLSRLRLEVFEPMLFINYSFET